MQRRNIIIMAVAALLVGSCGVPEKKFRLNGKFKNIRSADIFVFDDEGYDTLRVRDGKFRYECHIEEPRVITVQYPDFSVRRVIAEPGKKARFLTDASDLAKTQVTGTEENELLSQFYTAVAGKREGKAAEEAAEFVRRHPHTLAAQTVFEDFILRDGKTEGDKAVAILNLMLRKQPRNARLSRLAGKVTNMLATLPGAKAPEFNVRTFKGDTVTLKSFKGRYLLVTFWAAWQYDSFQRVRGLRGTVRPYLERLSLINVCMDYDIRSFRNTLMRDTLPGHNVCDKLGWGSPLVKAFGVARIPGNVLVSPDGKIIVRDLELPELRARLSKLIPRDEKPISKEESPNMRKSKSVSREKELFSRKKNSVPVERESVVGK